MRRQPRPKSGEHDSDEYPADLIEDGDLPFEPDPIAVAQHIGGPLVISADHEVSIDTVALEARVGYQQRLLADTSARLDTAQEEIKHLQQRLTQMEVFVHKLHQDQGVAREVMERQTRHSALDLASRTAGTPDSSVIIPLYETFLAVLRGQVH